MNRDEIINKIKDNVAAVEILSYANEVVAVAKCACGALTIYTDGKPDSIHIHSDIIAEYVPQLVICHAEISTLDINYEYCNCNHCVNHWGVDLCPCGCGNKFWEKCDNEY